MSVFFFEGSFLFSEHVQHVVDVSDVLFTSGNVGGQLLDKGDVFFFSFFISFFSFFSFVL